MCEHVLGSGRSCGGGMGDEEVGFLVLDGVVSGSRHTGWRGVGSSGIGGYELEVKWGN